MKMNQAGIDLIKQFESCRLDAYPDPGTGGPPITIGFGHTGPEVHLGVRWTQEQADEALKTDIDNVSTKVTKLLKATLTDNQFSALVCFAYNVGVHNLETSTMLKLINAGNLWLASNEFGKWSHAAGKELAGLVKRRAAEQMLFKTV